jgi:NADH-quinone oxidoreductase subunit N
LILFSIAGIPPLAGFFSKLFVLLSIVSEEYFLSSILIVLTSSVACFYYIRLLKVLFFKAGLKTSICLSNTSRKNSEIVICVLLTLNVLFFTFPDLLSNFCLVLGLILF